MMAKIKIKIRIKIKWWVFVYIETLRFFCLLFNTQPDYDKLKIVIKLGTKIV